MLTKCQIHQEEVVEKMCLSQCIHAFVYIVIVQQSVSPTLRREVWYMHGNRLRGFMHPFFQTALQQMTKFTIDTCAMKLNKH